MPKNLLHLMDLRSLKLTNKSFVSRAGKHSHSDLVYSVRLSRKLGDAYIVLEHFSTSRPDIPLIQLEYNVALLQQHLQEEDAKLSLIFNICLYSGKEPHKGEVTALDLFAKPDLIRLYWLGGNQLANLQQDTPEKIIRDEEVAFAELLLKEGKAGNFYKLLNKYGYLLQKGTLPYMEVAILYILQQDSREETLEKLKELTNPRYKNLVMSIAQRLRTEGREEGIQKGIQKGRQEGREEGKKEGMHTRTLDIARNMLHNLKLGIDVIQQATGLSKTAISRLRRSVPSPA